MMMVIPVITIMPNSPAVIVVFVTCNTVCMDAWGQQSLVYSGVLIKGS